MPLPRQPGRVLDNCCCGCSLKTGSIISGVLGIIIGAATLALILSTDMKIKTIIIDTLPPSIVKIILAINLVFTILISVLLLIGVIYRHKFLMLPWVILAITLAVGLAFSVLYTAVVFILAGEVFGGMFWIVGGLITVAIYVYMWLVVYSYYQLLREETDRGPYSKPAYAYRR
uniref:Uncharacterized protein n=1 Tax=Cacopsylla melanoneura TaxID=428564 RepID=A0A8D8XN21_9HEMI